jgi:hypothetical protein
MVLKFLAILKMIHPGAAPERRLKSVKTWPNLVILSYSLLDQTYLHNTRNELAFFHAPEHTGASTEYSSLALSLVPCKTLVHWSNYIHASD